MPEKRWSPIFPKTKQELIGRSQHMIPRPIYPFVFWRNQDVLTHPSVMELPIKTTLFPLQVVQVPHSLSHILVISELMFLCIGLSYWETQTNDGPITSIIDQNLFFHIRSIKLVIQIGCKDKKTLYMNDQIPNIVKRKGKILNLCYIT